MEYNMTDEQRKLFDYLTWLSKFLKKNKSFNNKEILEKNELNKDNVFNIQMLRTLYGIIKMYAEHNKIDVEVIDNKKEYFVCFNKIYFKIGKYINNDDLVYVERTNDKYNYFIDLNNLVGKYTVKIDMDLNNIHYGISNLLKKGLSIIEIRKILDDYLNVFEQEEKEEKEKINMELEKKYNHEIVEEGKYDKWKEAGYFECDVNSKKKPF